MNQSILKKNWLLPAVLILFILEIILFPFAIELTYAGSSESPNHILTYTTGKLTWDNATNIDENGVAEINLFDSSYQNVQSADDAKVLAPGTNVKNIVRLKNDANRSIQYVAVMYVIKKEPALPVEPILLDGNFTDTAIYPLPDGVDKSQVVRAVTGEVKKEQIEDFAIAWRWNYYESDERDIIDTALGNKAAFDIADEVTAGLYIVVEEDHDPTPPIDPEEPNPPVDPDEPDHPIDPGEPDPPIDPGEPTPPEPNTPTSPSDPGETITPNNPDEANSSEDDTDYIYPQVPNTGDNSHIALYLVLMVISGGLVILLLLDRRKEKEC